MNIRTLHPSRLDGKLHKTLPLLPADLKIGNVYSVRLVLVLVLARSTPKRSAYGKHLDSSRMILILLCL